MEQPIVKTAGMSISTAWQEFCVKLLGDIDRIESETIKQDAMARSAGRTFSERKIYKEKLQQCKKYREIVKRSVHKKNFNIQDGDDEIILEKGYEYYFKYLNGGLGCAQ